MKLISYKEGQPYSQADPFIFKAQDGKFYIYTTGGDGVHGYVSDELCGEYSYIGIVMKIDDAKNYWAPCVIFYNGKYYMYASCQVQNSSDTGEAMHVASSDTPFGPFINGKKLLPSFSIDPHVVETADGLFMFYSTNDYGYSRAGTYIVVAKMPDPETVDTNFVPVVRPSLDEEIFKRDKLGEGKHWHTIEGAFYFNEDNYHYVIYSGNCYGSEYYFLGYSVAKSEETDLTKIKFLKYPNPDTYHPLIERNSFEEGTGHNSLIKLDGEYYVVYHARDLVNDGLTKGDRRTARICRLKVENGVLTAIRHEKKL